MAGTRLIVHEMWGLNKILRKVPGMIPTLLQCADNLFISAINVWNTLGLMLGKHRRLVANIKLTLHACFLRLLGPPLVII